MKSRRAARLSPVAIGVKAVRTNELKPNPHNPRMLFDRVPLDALKSSIGKVGILVPLTVYRAKGQPGYTILDGERRLRCARELGLKEVPVNQVAEPTPVQNIVTMFQIHKLRQDWELMPTALKLEVLMTEFREHTERRLAELTGLDQAVVSRCKKLLSYPRKYQDMMLHNDPDKRVKADFFIELYVVRNDRFVNQMDWYSKDEFTGKMLAKYQNPKGGLRAVTDFRAMKQHISNARKANKGKVISKRLREFTEDDLLPLDYLAIPEARISASVRVIMQSIARLENSLRELDAEQFYGEHHLWDALEKLGQLIRSKLREAERRE